MAKWLQRITGVLLSAIMLFVSYIAVPAKAIADDAEEAAQTEAIEAYADANGFSQDNSLAYSPLVGELREDRDESVKVFRRADGAQEAVVYSDPIHFLKDEAWETIDNTLELVTLEDGTQAYRNKANDFIVSFSPHFNADNLITVESKGHILSWRFTEDVLFAQEEAAETPEESEPAEEPAVPEETEPSEEPVAPEEDSPAESADDFADGSVEAADTDTIDAEAAEPFDSEDAELPAEDDSEEVASEDPATEEPEATETEEPIEEEPEVVETEKPEEATSEEPEAVETEDSAYETLKITDAKAEIAEREHKEPETDEERDMLLRYPEELTSELTYKDPETGLNVHYVLSGKRLSEQIVLDHAPETAIAYSTLLTTNGLKAEEKDGRIVFVDESGEAIFEIMPPVMYDANGEESTEIEVRLIETEDGYAYTLIPDMKWLQESRMYPVVVDPDIRPLFSGNVDDTYVRSAAPNGNFNGRDCIYVSPAASDLFYSLIKLRNLPGLKSGDIILNATIHLTRYFGEGNYKNILVTGYRITEPWDVDDVTYNTLPTYESTASVFAVTARTNYTSDLDITSLIKDWYDETSANNGILLKSDGYALFRSSEYNAQYSLHPSVSIVYRNSTGLESNWTYYSQSAGRAGTGSVNLASGNLTWTLSDGGITNGVLPISLSHVYNVNDIGSNLGYGRGWRLNYSQMLKRFPVENGNETVIYFEYTDGDGTRHYYKEDGDKFVNELDKNSVLTFDDSNATATITDKGDNKLVFQTFTSGSGSNLEKNGRLIRIEDANGNKTEITYKNATGWSLRISKITEHLNGLSAGQELVLNYYEDNNFLKSITAPNGLNITFTYSVNDDLASATYTDGKTITFNYSDHRLAKATNIDGYNLRYIYNSRNGIRMVTEYAGNEEGQHLLFGYGRNKTVITDSQNRKTIYMTDSLGQPISVTDPDGRAMYATYNTGEQTVTQLSAVSKLQYSVVNLLKNHGFEQSSSSFTNWTKSGTGISVDSNTRKDGRRSAKFTATTTERTLSQTVAVTSGQTYTLSAYFKGSGKGQMKAVTGSNTFTGDPITANDTDWTRATVTFTATSNSAIVSIVIPANSGIIYADSVQLEKAPTPNRYNMLENSDFSNGTDGYARNYTTDTGVVTLSSTNSANHPTYLGNKAYRFATQMKGETYVAQTITVDGHVGDTYSFGAWMQSTCPTETQQWYNYGDSNSPSIHKVPIGVKRLTVEFLNGSGTVLSSSTITFAVDTKEWQFASGVAVASKNYSQIRIKASVTRCIGETLVDGIQFYHETFSQAYSYDEDGNLTGSKSLIGQENSFEYDDHDNVISSTDPRGNSISYSYYDNTHNVENVTTAEGVRTHYNYNARGQVYHTRVGTDAYHVDTNVERGNGGALLSRAIDARGKATIYTNQASTRLNTKITDPKGYKTTYEYGDATKMHRLASMTSDGLGVVKYGYDTYGKLDSIEVGEYVEENGVNIWKNHNKYNLTYDMWNRPISTKVRNHTLSSNEYDNSFRLSTVTYANGLLVRYDYDYMDRVNKIYQTLGNNPEQLSYEMIYNGEGDLYEIRNYWTHRASFFEYDHAGRCMASKERAFDVTNGVISYGAILSSYGYQYDECNNLSKLTCSVANNRWSTTYTYDKDNRSKKTILNSGVEITNTYNAIGLVSSKTIGLATPYETKIFYMDLGNGKRAPLIDYYKNGNEYATHYEYDDNGNIMKIERSDGANPVTYEYDEANRLIRENNSILNQTITYDYDDFGNITEKNTYAYTTALNPGTAIAPAISYIYDDSADGWGDQLVSYNGQTIEYDAMGNPTTYRGYTFGWRGRQLMSVSSGTISLTFEYNEDGLRQKKSVNNVDTDYFYNGSVLIGMQRGTDKLLFSYDASGNVVSVDYNGEEYYYLRNAQNDIIKLINASGTPVVEYTYDTWGKKVSITGTHASTLGTLQPFRYRGYVYDEETGLYYLQSRYYDAEVGRFISADILLSTGQGVLGHNAYAYCIDNPANMIDGDGHDGTVIIIIILILLLTGCSNSGSTCSEENADIVILESTSAPTQAPVPTLSASPTPSAPLPADIVISRAEFYAKEKTPYEGSNGKDCSTFVQTVVLESDVDPDFPDGARYQYDYVLDQDADANGLWHFYPTSDPSVIPRGAIVFYSAPTCDCGYKGEVHHVAISCGDGDMYDSTKVEVNGILIINGVSRRSIYTVLTHTCKEDTRCGVNKPAENMVIIGYAYPRAWE